MCSDGKNMSEKWLKVSDGLPPNGDYTVKVVKNGEEVVTKRRLRNGHWFGGCRPFTDGETVTHYQCENT